LLKGLVLFSGCPEEALKEMVKRLDVRDVPAGKVLLMDQEIARTLFLLSKGSVGVWKRVGGEKKQLATLKAPDFFGERSMFEEAPASALVKSAERCLIYALERAQLDEVAAQFPGLLDPLRRNMAEVRQKRLGPTPPKENPSGDL
jgi:CRP-like cAMP-binding protein